MNGDASPYTFGEASPCAFDRTRSRLLGDGEDGHHAVEDVRHAGLRVDDEADDGVGARVEVEHVPCRVTAGLQGCVGDAGEGGDQGRTGGRGAAHPSGEVGDDIVGGRAVGNAVHHHVV